MICWFCGKVQLPCSDFNEFLTVFPLVLSCFKHISLNQSSSDQHTRHGYLRIFVLRQEMRSKMYPRGIVGTRCGCDLHPPKSKCVWNNIYMYIRIMHARHIFTRRPNQPNQIHDESHGERQHLIYTIWQYLWFWACILEEYVLYINTRRSPESEQMALGWGCCCCCWSWLLPTEFGKKVCIDDYWTFIYICVHKYLGRIFGVSVGWTSGIWKHLFGFEMQLNDALFYVAIWFTSTEKR